MDSQHRHDLKENDLLEFLLNVKEWWAKYGTILLIVLLVIVGSYTVRRVIVASSQAQHEAVWSDLASSTSPEVYRTIADTATDPAIRSLATLRGADLLLQRLIQPQANMLGDADGILSDEQRERMLQDAQMMYSQVANDPSAHLLYRLNAQLGLATIAEATGQIAQSEQIYRDVELKAAGLYDAIAVQAAGRRAMLDRLARPVVFAPPQQMPAVDPDQADHDHAGNDHADHTPEPDQASEPDHALETSTQAPAAEEPLQIEP